MTRSAHWVGIVLAAAILLSQVLGTTAIAQGPIPGGQLSPETAPEWMDATRERLLATVAQLVGMSAEELKVALADGKKLSDLAEEKGTDVASVYEAVETEWEEVLDEAVQTGRISDEQAGLLRDRMAMHFLGDMARWLRFPLPDRPRIALRASARRAFRAGVRVGRILGLTTLDRDTRIRVLSTALGMPTETVRAALEEGKTIRDLADQAGVERRDVYKAVCCGLWTGW